MAVEYKICQRCIMDTTSDPNLELDENGVCNYCRDYDKKVAGYAHFRDEKFLEETFDRIKKDSKDREYDCVLGISGGVDSSYMAYLAHEYDLRVLAVHVDGGWNSELAVKNVENICRKLKLDLHTIVIDWPTMKELQRAYMYSGLANLDVPQDHAFINAVSHIMRENNVKYILNGNNLATEGILSNAFQQQYMDWRCIKDVFAKHGRGSSLKKYPHNDIFRRNVINPILEHQEVVYPLNYMQYSKKDAIAFLEKEYDWKYYGGKHYESRFTKFFQESYLPERYGWEKRRDHLSSLIVGGEMTREEALAEMAGEPSTEHSKEEEKEYVFKKLDMDINEWENIVNQPKKTIADYKSDADITTPLKKILGRA